MTYSLMVVQPRVGRFFTDQTRREELLILLAKGNRSLYLAAAAVFWHVSWRHWPARVFARPDELPRYRRRLRTEAWTMLSLVGTAYAVAVVVTLWRV